MKHAALIVIGIALVALSGRASVEDKPTTVETTTTTEETSVHTPVVSQTRTFGSY